MPSTRSILENVFGLLGIVFWSFQLLPQAIDNYKAKSTEGLSYSMFFIWTLCALGFGSYGVVEELSIPLIVQPQIFGFLSMVCYMQCLYYGMRTKEWWTLKRTMMVGCGAVVAMVGVQVGAVYATRAGINHNVPGTVEAAGIIPILLLVLGFIPQYIDIYRDRSVVGVSMAFIAADAAGAIFSIISLCFRSEFDLLATCNYIAVLVCDAIVVFFWVYFNKMHPELARVRGGGGGDLENGIGSEEKEVESAIVTIVEPEVDGGAMEEEKGLEETIMPDYLQVSPVVKAPTAASQVSLSSAHTNSTVAQA
ncbi:MAG: PQ loop repeat-domain-containing protein [Linnemannia gamsii]|nr:MAG: PQ loop repeat-domain-containing protein [Linnemannia gamsii]